jgi:hypothetical protein
MAREGRGQEFWHFFDLKNMISTHAKEFSVENTPNSPDFKIF